MAARGSAKQEDIIMARKHAPEIEAFADELVGAVRDMKAGRAASTYTPADVEALRRGPGRPVGSTAAIRLESLNMRMEPATMAKLRSLGAGWQTKLRAFVARAVETDLEAIASGTSKPIAKVRVQALATRPREAVARLGDRVKAKAVPATGRTDKRKKPTAVKAVKQAAAKRKSREA